VIRRLILSCIILSVLAACSSPAGEEIAPQAATNAPVPPTELALLPTLTPEPGAPLAARVNGVPIELAVFENEAARRLQALRDHGIDLDTPEGQATVQAVRSQALEALIEDELIAQAAAQLGLAVSDEQVEALIQQDINNVGGEEAFKTWLTSNGMSIEEHRLAQRTAILNNTVRDRITAGVPTEAEQVHARHIQVLTQEEANQLLSMLQAGADFGALAQQYSTDPLTSASGGDLGWFPRGGLFDPLLEETAFALQPGQISNVTASEFGGQTVYEIVQLIEREAARPLSVDNVQRLQQQSFLRWLEDLKTKAQIERLVTP
jgi:parvulin-like peptidyl-prolyl isomerase